MQKELPSAGPTVEGDELERTIDVSSFSGEEQLVEIGGVLAHARTHTCTHTHTYVRTHTHTHKLSHTHTYTHTGHSQAGAAEVGAQMRRLGCW